MKNIISLENISWRRNNQEILTDVNWEVNEGEHWGILGLNGSGKTSILNIVTGYNYPTSGNVHVLGNEFGKTNLPDLRKQIGYVSSSLEQFSSVLDMETPERIAVSGKYASIGLYEDVLDEDWNKADQILSELRLDYVKGKRFRTLSQGERRRVLIARALINDPDILILDEPCSGLDVLSREEMLDLMNDIQKKNCHLLYVTHHIEEIVEAISHVLLVRDGKVIAAGPKQNVLTDENLTKTFKTPVNVRWEEDRPWLTILKRNNS